jgi:beta-galactosidase
MVLGYGASLMCGRPGKEEAAWRLVRYALDSYRSPYSCQGALVYRLAAPEADHYFLISDGPARSLCLDWGSYRYVSLSDPVAQCELEPGAPVSLEAYSGRWLRFEKEVRDV